MFARSKQLWDETRHFQIATQQFEERDMMWIRHRRPIMMYIRHNVQVTVYVPEWTDVRNFM
jgi:hypothetical protein